MEPLRPITLDDSHITIGTGRLALFAGPCVLESLEGALAIGEEAAESLCFPGDELRFLKPPSTRRTEPPSPATGGPGLEEGLEWLAHIRDTLKVPVLTDIHEPWQAEKVAEVASILQISRLSLPSDGPFGGSGPGRGGPVNVKKAQFLDPRNMAPVVQKLRDSGASRIMLCERGNKLRLMVNWWWIFAVFPSCVPWDVPWSSMLPTAYRCPGGKGDTSGGDRRFVPRTCPGGGLGGNGCPLCGDPSGAGKSSE